MESATARAGSGHETDSRKGVREADPFGLPHTGHSGCQAVFDLSPGSEESDDHLLPVIPHSHPSEGN